MAKVKLYAGLALIAIVLIVIFQNTEPVETKLLFFTVIMPRAVLLAVTMLIGVATGILVTFSLANRLSRKK